MSAHGQSPRGREFWALSLAALGVVYGDIGTSPIYAIRESFHVSHGIAASVDNTYGILSLIFWSLIIVISFKYLFLVMKADNRGEGGIIALTALVMPRQAVASAKGARHALVLLGLFGAALLYGDSMITPAISVLSAVEGLHVAVPALDPWVLPLTIGILVGLFAFQKRGTGGVGAVFGPVTLVWFVTLAVLGAIQILHHPGVLRSLSPHYALHFFQENGPRGILVLGSVFLVVTGGEALYADMGHFGKRPIRVTWTAVVLPSLLLNYFGQGALIIAEPETVEHPFFSMAPEWAGIPLVILATAATVIASQAVISGAFSLTRQAVQLGYLPRFKVDHTSDRHIGQIYMPAVNWALMLACIGLVLGFRTSGNLAAAYGVAVTTDMVFTTLLFAVVAHLKFRWKLHWVVLLAMGLLVVDLAFWGANLPKIPHGGWFPLLVALAVFTLMTTWNRGRAVLAQRFEGKPIPTEDFLRSIQAHPPPRVPGTAIFMTSNPHGVPSALLHNLKHNKVLHERVFILTIEIEDRPRVREPDRLEVRDMGQGFHRIVARYGFTETPDVPEILGMVKISGYEPQRLADSFFLGEVTVVVPDRPVMARWRSVLFERMTRNSLRASAYFNIPPDRVVGLGAQVEI
ncbi:MAG: potassium transporter Kup [Gemmatimonadota bacterium]